MLRINQGVVETCVDIYRRGNGFIEARGKPIRAFGSWCFSLDLRHHVDCFHLSQCAAWHLRRDLFFIQPFAESSTMKRLRRWIRLAPPGTSFFLNQISFSNYADCGLCKLLMFRVVQVALVCRAQLSGRHLFHN